MDYREGETKMINRVNRTLLDDVEKVYFSIRCTSAYKCECCKNKQICDITKNLLKSLKIFYICNRNPESCSKCSNIEGCEIIQKIY